MTEEEQQQKSEKAVAAMLDQNDSAAIFMSETECLRMYTNLDFELAGMTPRIARDVAATAGFLKSIARSLNRKIDPSEKVLASIMLCDVEFLT